MTRLLLPLPILLVATALTGCPKSRSRSGDAGPAGPGDGDPGCRPAMESCNGADDDCDGLVDEELLCGCPPDRTACGELCVYTESDPSHCGGCFSPCAPGRECVDGACCTRTPVEVDALDVLFLIDNSNSMTEEQASFAEQLPRIVQVLGSGDLNGDGTQDFEPPPSVHFGVVTTDMGTGGVAVPTCDEPRLGDDGILRTEGNTAIPGCMPIYPSFLELRPGDSVDPDLVAADLTCVARMGTGGCGFEQHLEAVLKAVTPSTSDTRFFSGSTGHADGANEGFLRRDAVLAVLVLSDEEDCSAADPGLFDPASRVYVGNLNLRCSSYPMAVHPLERYIDGLLAAKADPSLLSFSLIAGIPPDLVASGTGDYDAILADDRMQERVDPSDPTRLAPSCNVPGRGLAFPPRRLVRLSQELEDAGASVSLGSICQADFTTAVNTMLNALAIAEPVSTTCTP